MKNNKSILFENVPENSRSTDLAVDWVTLFVMDFVTYSWSNQHRAN